MPETTTDHFSLDIDQIHTLADDQAVREGLGDFKAHRVTWVELEEGALNARVEDAVTEEEMSVLLHYDGDGNLQGACSCGGLGRGPCRHGVAALFAYADRARAPAGLSSASESALEERVQSGRAEVRVEPLSGEPGLGTWRAWSLASTTHFPRRYTVHIRSLARRANYCSCPDFAVNQLGTCKHIEAVLHRLRKRPDFEELRRRPLNQPFVHLDWEGEEAPGIRLQRGTGMDPELARLLDDHFDEAGRFLRRMPDDLLRLAELLQGVEGIDIGEDAIGFAHRLAEQAARALRGERIRGQIQSLGGRIPGVKARLYPYQMDGVAFLAATGRALLADDMGLGKTLQAIAAASWLRENAGVERVLIVCPASLKHQWAREIERFCDTPVQIVQGNAEARGAQYRRGPGFYVANYELILRDVTVINETLRPDLLILDEAQRIKNWRTKIASAVKLIPSRYAFVLSGTPLENRLEDLYSLLQVVDPHVLGPLWRYLVDFHVTDDKGKVLGYRNLSELRRRLQPVMLRRDRRLVRDQLPDRIVQRIDVELTPRQRDLHGSALQAAAAIADIARRRPLTPGEQNRMMAALQSARMVCDAAGLVDKETEGSPKLDELTGLLDELCVQSGLKAVIFSQWEGMTRMAEERVRALGLGSVRLHGGIPTPKRGELMDRFRDDDAVQVFISTDAGATGLNLQSASVLINLDIPWNPAVLEQRNARIHRLGQQNKVQIILLVAAGAYEESVLYMVEGKRNLFENVVEGDATEDVVGVSRRLVEVLVDDLNREGGGAATTEGEDGEGKAEGPQPDEPAATAPGEPGEPLPPTPLGIDPEGIARRWNSEAAEAVRGTITALQAAFGPRIERILGSGGGLMVVLDRVDDEADRIAAELSAAVPVALIDPRTLGGLQRLGAASPVAEADTLFEAPAPAPESPRLLRQSAEKLQAAGLLIEQRCLGPAVELLVGALLAAVAHLAGEAGPPEPQRAGVWLYGELLPKGLLAPAQAGVIARALALAQSGGELPEAMVRELAMDAQGVVDGCGLRMIR